MLRIQLIPAKEIVKVTEDGKADFGKMKELLDEISALTDASQNFVIMVDARQITPGLSTVDLWYLARELHEHGTTFNRRSALLVRPDAINSAQLFALFAQNRGFLVNAFSSFEEAVDWLLPSSEASAAPPLQSP